MNLHNLRAVDYAGHMLTFIQQIETYLLGKTIEDLRREPMVRDAVLRNMEILGEAANNLRNAYPELEEKFPEIPFTQIYGMRNHLAHGYFVIDIDILWKVIQRDLRYLSPQIEAVVAFLKSSSATDSTP